MFRSSVYFAVLITFLHHIALTNADNKPTELFSPTRQPFASLKGKPKLHPAFQQMLSADDPNKQVNAWILFTDKGISITAKKEHETCINARAKRRRQQRAKDGIIHFTDLSLYQQYIDDTRKIGGKQRCVSRWLNGISIEVSLKELQQLQLLPFVKAIDPVLERRIAEREEKVSSALIAFQAPLNPERQMTQLSQIAVDKLHTMGYHGEGILIGLLDTGFDLSHEAIKSTNVVAEWDFINNDGNTADELGQDDQGQDGHGSIMLSVISGNSPGRLLGTAYQAGFLLGKTEKNTENGGIFEKRIEEDWWIAGLEWMERLGVDVVNSSGGYGDWYRFADLDGKTAKMTIAADLAVEKGVVMVIAAGNGGGKPLGDLGLPGRINVPADGFGVLAVGAVDAEGRAASFSAHGPTFDGRIKPEVAAMGVDVTTIKPGTREEFSVQESGTSVSSALVSGAVALLLQAFPQATPDDISYALKATASLAAKPDNTLGWGIINAEAAYDLLLKRFGAGQITVETCSYTLTSWGTVKQHTDHQNLGQNYPNPFNSETWIPFSLTSPANVTVSIYDLKGKLIKQLQLGWLPAGNYLDSNTAAYWNGLNNNAEPISSGVYFYKIEAEGARGQEGKEARGQGAKKEIAIRKMVVVR
ncbi:T9SS type A sorting domain-containing protein [Candidatus Poribacteria bacterium]|nr:T9SS type A sorting domain-containing protein [Candidatus Poribacteria bacterium]